MTRQARILVVDDEAHIREVIHYALDREGYAVELAADGAGALARLPEGFDLVVLDILMPELDGLSLCRRVRQGPAATARLPIIFVSSRAEELDRIVGLDLGADDYLIKPFSPRELVARVRSVLRRAASETPADERLTFGALVVDTARHEARVGGEPLAFTATELAILCALLADRGRVLSREDLVDRAYTTETHVTLRTMDTHVRRIRAKLRPFGLEPIETVHGVGYRAASPP
jgi:two-component system OmpR family response regulator